MLPLHPKHKIFNFLMLIALLFAFQNSYAQLQFPGKAEKRYQLSENINLSKPAIDQLNEEDYKAALADMPYRIGEQVVVNVPLFDKATSADAVQYARFSIEGAQALGLEFSKMNLPKGAKLFVYNPENETVLGAFTRESFAGTGVASIRPVTGSTIVIEYHPAPGNNEKPDIFLSGITYYYRGMESLQKNLKAGYCEVSVACDEALNYKDEKNSVVKIISKIGPSSFWCSGTLLNNTSLDFTPYILTAYHCSKTSLGGNAASEDDLNRWIFYFLNERTSCSSSSNIDDSKTITGAAFVASTDYQNNLQSDFYMVRLNQTIPATYKPFYSGWNHLDNPPASGVCIHHPDGDDKKISTFTATAQSGTWETTPNTHWLVNWAETENGHGVTEGGSSGAPLFDADGYYRGSLTGGESECSNPAGTDYFGKIAWSWNPTGSSNKHQLKCWLDPVSNNVDVLQGLYNTNALMASFRADTAVIPVNGSAQFINLSGGDADSFYWYFEGGNPSEYTGKNPPEIYYSNIGTFDVKLLIKKENQKDSLLIGDYIQVKPINYPNPVGDFVTLFVGKDNTSGISYEIYNVQGKLLEQGSCDYAAPSYSIKLPENKGVYYFLKIKGNNFNETLKVLRINE